MKHYLNIALAFGVITAIVFLIFNKCHNKESDTPKEIEATLYFVAYEGADVKGKVFGCNDILVPVTKKLTVESSDIETALDELISQKDTPELHNFVKGPGLFLLKVLIANNEAEVFLKGDFDITTKCDIDRIQQQLVETAKQFNQFKEVKFYIGDMTLERYLAIAREGFK
jgi:hypothetical protein